MTTRQRLVQRKSRAVRLPAHVVEQLCPPLRWLLCPLPQKWAREHPQSCLPHESTERASRQLPQLQLGSRAPSEQAPHTLRQEMLARCSCCAAENQRRQDATQVLMQLQTPLQQQQHLRLAALALRMRPSALLLLQGTAPPLRCCLCCCCAAAAKSGWVTPQRWV